MTVFVYVNTSKQVGDPEHLKVFATADAAAKWFEERFWNELHCSCYEAPRLRVSNSKLTRIAVQAAKAAKDIKRSVVSMGNLQPDDSQLFKL
jgi:hypothetical protein